MHFTYVLLCNDSKMAKRQFYIGSTKDLKNRLAEHKKKEAKTTRGFPQIFLVYYEACINKTDARKRELQLKSGFGRGYINRRIKSYLEEFNRRD